MKSALLAAFACLSLSTVPAAAATLLTRHTLGAEAGRIDVLRLPGAQAQGQLGLRCERMHYGSGVLACLRAVPGQGLKLDLADKAGQVGQTLSFPNVLLASRVRVAADGALVAFTGFSSGHTYTGTDFATRTYVVDAARRRLLADLSTFRVVESAALKMPARRFNVWGVSFDPAAQGRFVATVGAGGEVFLAQGDLAAKTLVLLRKDMECPSYSPDGKRIAFKRRKPGGGWLPAVYEPASGREWVLQEARSLDDQILWLDNATIAYELVRPGQPEGGETDVVVRAASGSGPSTVLRAGGGSPSLYD
jgi:hypothetical protein